MEESEHEIEKLEIPYAQVDGQQLKLLIYRPTTPAHGGSWPAMLDIHGGAWNHFDHRVDFYWCEELAKRGYVTIAIEFRHAPEKRWPTMILDLRAAARYVFHHAAELNLDRSRIGAIGGSSGGHLATWLGLWPNESKDGVTKALDTPDDVPVELAWVIALWPIMDVPGRYQMVCNEKFGSFATKQAERMYAAEEAKQARGEGDSTVSSQRRLEGIHSLRQKNQLLGEVAGAAAQFVLGALPSTSVGKAFLYKTLKEAHEKAFDDIKHMVAASPLHRLRAGEVEKLPPIYINQGRKDANMTLEMTENFCSAYRQLDGEVTFDISDGGHSFGNVPSRAADELIATIADFAAGVQSRSAVMA